jgi:predicted Zn finger-like uncharacterized protein
MAITVTCPACARAYTVPEAQTGKRVRCKECAETFVVGPPPASLPGRVPPPIPEVVPVAEHDLPSVLPADDYRRPRRRRSAGVPLWVWLAGGGAAVAVGLGILAVVLFVVLGVGSPVTKANYLKLQPGMTEAEVRSILGRPDQVVDTGQFMANIPVGMQVSGFGGIRQLIWRQGRRAITVTIMNDRVVGLGSQNLD